MSYQLPHRSGCCSQQARSWIQETQRWTRRWRIVPEMRCSRCKLWCTRRIQTVWPEESKQLVKSSTLSTDSLNRFQHKNDNVWYCTCTLENSRLGMKLSKINTATGHQMCVQLLLFRRSVAKAYSHVMNLLISMKVRVSNISAWCRHMYMWQSCALYSNVHVSILQLHSLLSHPEWVFLRLPPLPPPPSATVVVRTAWTAVASALPLTHSSTHSSVTRDVTCSPWTYIVNNTVQWTIIGGDNAIQNESTAGADASVEMPKLHNIKLLIAFIHMTWWTILLHANWKSG